ncbi:MAG: ComEA family DNA-binding protein [Chloroflexi bacterium]|nr:ComEA family DNA-binding protein [Chloroflexota bacterium]
MEPPSDTPVPTGNPPPTGSRANMATWLIAGVSIALFLAGGGYWLASRPNPSEIEIFISTPEPAGPVVAHIDGEVRSPGVYTLVAGARVEDGIAAAGGVTERADLRSLNRAALLLDGQRISIPAIQSRDESAADAEATTEQTRVGPVDLNTADLIVLQTLPGIGEVKAQAIIDWRDRNGLFTSVDDLLSVAGIGPVTVEALRPLVVP